MNLFLTKEVLYLLSYVGVLEAAGKRIGEGLERGMRERDQKKNGRKFPKSQIQRV